MNSIFEMAKVILPVLITNIFTFIITKYTYNRNTPLDKLEIAYNRIYYPICRIIHNENDMQKNMNQIEVYLYKYNKYVDNSTMRLFKLFQKCKKVARKRSIYIQFKDNVYNRHSYLRRRLGYLEPNFAQLYKCFMPSEKSFFRISIELCIIYCAIMSDEITANISNIKNYNIFSIVFITILFIVIFELVWCFIRFLYYKIRK